MLSEHWKDTKLKKLKKKIERNQVEIPNLRTDQPSTKKGVRDMI